MSTLEALIDVDKYFYIEGDENWPFLQTGIIWMPTEEQQRNPSGVGKPLESQKLSFECLAPVWRQKKRKRSHEQNMLTQPQCGKKMDNIGPYCRTHSIAYNNISVDASSIGNDMRGLFARASRFNGAEMRKARTKNERIIPQLRRLTEAEFLQYKNRQKPLFTRGDIVAHFGGVLQLDRSKLAADVNSSSGDSSGATSDSGSENENAIDAVAVAEDGGDTAEEPCSYAIDYNDVDMGRDCCASIPLTLDSCVESSGEARFANSIVKWSGRVFGAAHINCKMGEIIFDSIADAPGLLFGAHEQCIKTFPCLFATCDVYDGDEFITDYGDGYWKKEYVEKMSKAVQDYLFGFSDVEPDFFADKQT